MNAPGCFGAASVFAHDSHTCQQCPAFDDCSKVALERLQAISGIVNVSDLLKKHASAQHSAGADRAQRHQSEAVKETRVIQRAQPIETIQRKTTVEKVTFEIDPITFAAIASISNKKANAQAITLCKGMTINKIRADLNEQVNPFGPTPAWLNLVGESLASNAESFTRPGLKALFVERLGWSEGTAGSHVAIAIALVTGLGIAVEHEGSFILLPSPDGHDCASQ